MSETPYILVIAPDAPPKNTPEAIQVRRIMEQLDRRASGQLVMAAPLASSRWGQADKTLALTLTNFDTVTLKLPLHAFTSRVLMSNRLASLHVPDSLFWLRSMVGRVRRGLTRKPDVIYSRSAPMSGAVLACRLKQILGVPWVMHLSDPWVDSPYKTYDPRDAIYEATCFAQADIITFTTQGQADFYAKKYLERAGHIRVSHNMMPDVMPRQSSGNTDDKLHLVFTGALYGPRSPRPLIEAIEHLRHCKPEVLKRMQIDVYGNVQQEALALLQQASDILHYHGPVSFAEAQKALQAADIVLTIEANVTHAIGNCFLPSKVMDCLAIGKPMLAITPLDSETARICAQGYGWAIEPAQVKELGARLAQLVEQLPQLRTRSPKSPPPHYRAEVVADALITHIQTLLSRD